MSCVSALFNGDFFGRYIGIFINQHIRRNSSKIVQDSVTVLSSNNSQFTYRSYTLSNPSSPKTGLFCRGICDVAYEDGLCCKE